MNLSKIIYEQLYPIIESWSDSDIYAISFLIYDNEDDPNRPTLTVGYNTEEWHTKSLERSMPTEARWNYAFWLQNNTYQIGYDENEEIIAEWVRQLDVEDDEVTEEFIREIQKVSLMIHDSGILKKKIGKPIPILIHELEYYDEIGQQTLEANPPGVAEEFASWCSF